MSEAGDSDPDDLDDAAFTTHEQQITRLLESVSTGSVAASDLLPLVYTELRALARRKMANEPVGHTLQATVLVHEAWLRVVGGDGDGQGDERRFQGRGHFFAAAAQAMRRILVEQARRRSRQKRGGDRVQIDVDPDLIDLPADAPGDDLLAVEEAVRRLEAMDPRKGQIVDLRYFAGLTNVEVAASMGLSVGTIEREWRFIRSWLQSELGD